MRLRKGDALCRELVRQIEVWMPHMHRGGRGIIPPEYVALLHDPLAVACMTEEGRRYVTIEKLPVTVAMHQGHVRTFIDPAAGRRGRGRALGEDARVRRLLARDRAGLSQSGLEFGFDPADTLPMHQREGDMIRTGHARNEGVYAEAQGFGIRLVAYLIDLVILIIIDVILRVALDTAGAALAVAAGALYTIGFWYALGATPGKMALGLQVVREDGSPLGPGTSVLRYVGYIVSGLALGLGFLWIIWDPKKQAWPDKIAGTLVVKPVR